MSRNVQLLYEGSQAVLEYLTLVDGAGSLSRNVGK